jgi:hypothetical protein
MLTLPRTGAIDSEPARGKVSTMPNAASRVQLWEVPQFGKIWQSLID